jgi:hypothetical protein
MNSQQSNPDSNNMLKKPYSRRLITVLLVILGGTMIYLASTAWAGILLLAMGIAIEVVGITLKHRDLDA